MLFGSVTRLVKFASVATCTVYVLLPVLGEVTASQSSVLLVDRLMLAVLLAGVTSTGQTGTGLSTLMENPVAGVPPFA